MRIAIICTPPQGQSPPDYVRSLAKGMESCGHQVDIINARTDDALRLAICDYIALVTAPASLFSAQIPDIIPRFLAAANTGGKKSAAFVKKSGLRHEKALANLMAAMEKEGMVINWSDFLLNASQAEALGKKIGA